MITQTLSVDRKNDKTCQNFKDFKEKRPVENLPKKEREREMFKVLPRV